MFERKYSTDTIAQILSIADQLRKKSDAKQINYVKLQNILSERYKKYIEIVALQSIVKNRNRYMANPEVIEEMQLLFDGDIELRVDIDKNKIEMLSHTIAVERISAITQKLEMLCITELDNAVEGLYNNYKSRAEQINTVCNLFNTIRNAHKDYTEIILPSVTRTASKKLMQTIDQFVEIINADGGISPTLRKKLVSFKEEFKKDYEEITPQQKEATVSDILVGENTCNE